MKQESASSAQLEHRYTSTAGDIPFEVLLAEYGVLDDDDQLAELIEADGRARIDVKRDVELSRYLAAIPGLASRSVPLDAAIDIALRGLSGGPRPSPEAVLLLQARYPELASGIAEAATLAQAIWSTTGLRRRVDGPRRELPCEFGPQTSTGKARFELRRELGSGGWGVVYLAVDRQLSEDGHEALVAIKLLTGLNQGPWARQRLVEEATKARRVDHPNVARVLDRGVSDQHEAYLVYQYVSGGDLGQWLAAQTSWPNPHRAAELVAKIARGVDAAHAAGIVHCDLKPGNILIDADGEPLVADFGIAVRAGDRIEDLLGATHGRPIGNLAFISPEQYRKEPGSLSVRSDVYALGGLLYYLVTRRLPNGESVEEIARNHERGTGRARAASFADRVSWIDQDLASIGERAMSQHPSSRYPSAAEFADDLEGWARSEELPWHRPSGTRSVALWCRRRPALAVSALLTVIVGLGGVSAAAYFAGKASKLSRQLDEQARTLAVASKLVSMARDLIGKMDTEGLLQDAMPSHLVGEWISGALVIGDPEEVQERWSRRIQVLDNYIADRRKSGYGTSIEVLPWETARGLYMVEAGDFERAEPYLRSNLGAWKSRVVGDDPFFRLIEHLIAVTRVQRLKAMTRDVGASAEQRAEMVTLAAELGTVMGYDADHLAGAPVHQLALGAYVDLCGPGMLDRPDEFTRAKSLLALTKLPRSKTTRTW